MRERKKEEKERGKERERKSYKCTLFRKRTTIFFPHFSFVNTKELMHVAHIMNLYSQ